ncbi:MAG: hypothetical protein Ct9H300mP7_4070 [Verrucomicrobiota bacterium]|nr:MAG: hypothetical protein Ct9H300mP7_4070 [Verrucomicrobiota bacterium]
MKDMTNLLREAKGHPRAKGPVEVWKKKSRGPRPAGFSKLVNKKLFANEGRLDADRHDLHHHVRDAGHRELHRHGTDAGQMHLRGPRNLDATLFGQLPSLFLSSFLRATRHP